jgi:hypothetical protein
VGTDAPFEDCEWPLVEDIVMQGQTLWKRFECRGSRFEALCLLKSSEEIS